MFRGSQLGQGSSATITLPDPHSGTVSRDDFALSHLENQALLLLLLAGEECSARGVFKDFANTFVGLC